MIEGKTKIHLVGGVSEASNVREGTHVKSLDGDRRVCEVSVRDDYVSKFVFSDGYKCLLSDSQYLMTPEMDWVAVSRIKEGMVFRTHGDSYVKAIDITPLGVKECISIEVEGGGSYILVNGMPTK